MASVLDPTFWMGNYAVRHRYWTGKTENPLFMMSDGLALTRSRMIEWFRAKAGAWHPNPEKLNGISFRRGGAQVLREQGISMDELGVLGRWLTMRAAARYVKLTDPILDRFANAFDRAAAKLGKEGTFGDFQKLE